LRGGMGASGKGEKIEGISLPAFERDKKKPETLDAEEKNFSDLEQSPEGCASILRELSKLIWEKNALNWRPAKNTPPFLEKKRPKENLVQGGGGVGGMGRDRMKAILKTGGDF